MCFDTEKTQAPRDLEREMLRDIRAKQQNEMKIGAVESAGYASRAYSDAEIVAELFKYHSPTPEQIPLYGAINQAAKNFAEVILSACPRGADRTAAIRLLRDARMTANAAIALNGLSL